MDQNFVQALHDLLVQSTSNDTSQVNSATARLSQEFYKSPGCIPALASILASSTEAPIRQLAAVELSKRVASTSTDLWIQVSQSEREQIKVKLPLICVEDSAKLVRHSTARVIASIASIELPNGTWNELLGIIGNMCHSNDPQHREIGSFILFTVLENVAEAFSDKFQELMALLQPLLADPASIEVRVNAVRSLGVLASWLDNDQKSDIKAMQSLVPAIIGVFSTAIESQDDAAVTKLTDVYETMLIVEAPVLGKHIPDLVQFLLQYGGNRSLDSDIRVSILNCLQWTISYKKSKIQGQNMAGAILQALFPITTEEEPEDPDDEAPSRSALRIIDTLSTKLPPTQVFPTLRDLIVQYFSSADAASRRGAMFALGVAVEGCSEYMTPKMNEIWPLIEAGLRDGDATVRKASCVGVSCLCEWLEEAVMPKHQMLLPGIMNLLDDPVTQKAACTALDSLLEIMHDVIGEYLPTIMERLGLLLGTVPLSVKAVVTSAIGSAAHASKDKFLPYFQPTMIHLQQFLLLEGEGEETDLRGITMDAIGTFAEAVGKEVFRPYVPDMMKHALSAVESGNARLRECSFMFVSTMARVFTEEFAPYLPSVVPALLNSVQQSEADDGLELDPEIVKAFSSDSGSSPSNAITISDDGDVTGGSIDLDKLVVNNAVAIEKEIAADTLGTLFAATQSHYLPYVEQSALQLINLLPHFYEGIRKSALESLLEIVRTFYKLSDSPQWIPAMSAETPLEGPLADLVGHALTALWDMYESEDDKGVGTSLCISLAETIQLIGPAFLQGGYYEKFCQMAKTILEQKAYFQQDPDQDEDEASPEEHAEEEGALIGAAEDLVAALALATGKDFTQAFQTFFPLIRKFYAPNRSLTDRSSSVGCLSEIIAGMKTGITPFTEPLMELFYQALSDKDADVYNNAAFAIGVLVEHSELDLSAQYGPILNALQNLFNVTPDSSETQLNARDNAAGAIARMICKNSTVLPLDQVLPLLISLLPLKNDVLENGSVFRAIIHLYKTHPGAISGYTEQLLPVFATALDPNSPTEYITTDVRDALKELIGALNGQNPSLIQAAGLGVYI
ncbi:ARM repeat-containing protein [Flagelloscypha sp. PMI_526]|nr:ARM repeat-containing protein [Flagelloscypha sp. PMI_526]